MTNVPARKYGQSEFAYWVCITGRLFERWTSHYGYLCKIERYQCRYWRDRGRENGSDMYARNETCSAQQSSQPSQFNEHALIKLCLGTKRGPRLKVKVWASIGRDKGCSWWGCEWDRGGAGKGEQGVIMKDTDAGITPKVYGPSCKPLWIRGLETMQYSKKIPSQRSKTASLIGSVQCRWW